MGGQAVQLVGGKDLALEAGDPRSIAKTFRLAGEIAVVDLDAALGRGDNREVIEDLLRIAPCRVGGGIRDVETALRWLDAGATQVVLGTAAVPEVLRRLPRERVVVALDSVDDEVVVDGWRERTGRNVFERIRALRDYAGGFLVTFVENEGRMTGLDFARVEALREAAGGVPLTVAGGIRTADEVGRLAALGVFGQVGMGLYTGEIDLADAIVAGLVSDRADGLWPTVVCDESGVALGLAYSDRESVREAVNRRAGVYRSRKRGLWIKGETSGATQELLRIDRDCDADGLRFTVQQSGVGFCHEGRRTCWGSGGGLGGLERRLAALRSSAPRNSYTRRLLEDPELLRAKLIEEADELAAASSRGHVAEEAADVLYFALVAMTRAGVSLKEVEDIFDRRALRVRRRAGDAKSQGAAK